MSNWVNFREVKTQIRLADVIRSYDVKLQSSGHGCLRGRCPLPTHSSKDSILSFSINTARNVWACHSQSCIAKRGGAIGGNVLDFVAVMEGCTIRDAAMILSGHLGVPGPSSSGNDRVLRPTVAASNRELGFRLFGVDPSHEYIAARGVSLATARLFGIGYYHGHGYFSGRVVIPIHNPAGQLIAYAGRSINGEEPKYRLPPAFRKSSELFNLHRAAREPCRRVLVVEGFFDCVKVHQAGFPNVVAMMGCSLSGQQADLLIRHFAEAALLLDGDEVGERATAKIAATLSGTMRVYRGRVPQGRQPDELVPAELRGVIEGATDASQ
jgi:DNA primase